MILKSIEQCKSLEKYRERVREKEMETLIELLKHVFAVKIMTRSGIVAVV